MTFLSAMLRDEGGYEYKKAIVDTLVDVISDNPEAKETGLNIFIIFAGGSKGVWRRGEGRGNPKFLIDSNGFQNLFFCFILKFHCE